MGKKRSKSAAATPAAPPPDNEDGAIDSSDLASQLLAEMGAGNTEDEGVEFTTPPQTPAEVPHDDTTSSQPKKRNRRKEKLAERERERARIVADAEEETSGAPNKRQIELDEVTKLIESDGLVVQEITPDGHCLFASVSDQLRVRYDIDVTVRELRAKAAAFIREHPDDFAPYLIDDRTGELRDLESYTKMLEETTMWGGELEIMAMSRIFNVPIAVYMASLPTLVINKDLPASPLRIAYYRQIYNLGAHYNSLHDAS